MKIVVNGAGIAGLTLAYCLLCDGHEVVLVEKSPRLRDAGFMIDFFGPGYDAAERLGILPDLQAIHYPVSRLTFLHSDGHEKLALAYASFRRRIFGDRHFNFMRGDLERVLYEKVSKASVARFGTSVESFRQHADVVEVVLSDQSRCQVDLLVGADGIHSTIRRLAFGQTPQPIVFLGYHAIAFLVTDPQLSDEIQDTLYTMTIPNKQISVYPVCGERIATLFLHRRDKPGSDFSPPAGIAELRETYGEMGWIIPRLLRLCGEQGGIYFDAVSQVVLPSWSKGRVVLIGDACHCVSLVAGQGASLAMAGAYVLYQEIVRSQGSLPTALARYEQRLRPVVESKQGTGRKMAKWFVPATTFRVDLRDFLIRTSTWPIASRFIRREVGAVETALFEN